MRGEIFFSLLAVTALLLALLTVKTALRSIMPAAWRYRLGYLNFFILLLPVLPCAGAEREYFTEFTAKTIETSPAAPYALTDGGGYIADLAISRTEVFDARILIALWAAGAALMAVFFLMSFVRLRRIYKTADKPGEGAVRIFEECKKELDISGNIGLLKGRCSSPMVFGLFRTTVLIPDGNTSETDLRNIFLHELTHYKRGDLAVNYAVCVFKAVYWFNPAVWLAFSLFKADMEEACDEAVMEHTGDGIGYGRTIICFAGKRGPAFTADMGSGKRRMIKRVRAAASFKRASAAQRIRGAAVFALSFALIAASLPAVSVNAVEPKDSGAEENYIAADMSEYFGGHEGSFVLYDSAADVYTIYNEKLSGERVSPDSTYKIFSALAALESGTISPTDSYMAWDGEENFFDEWNRDQDLETAMKNSVNWYFDSLNEEDMESLKAVFSAFDYGNEKTNGENFWMEGSLKISPKEQVDALKELYFNEHGFDSENIEAVKDAIRLSDGFYGKTGSGMVNGRNVHGWFVGFAEGEGNVWFFALNIRDAAGADAANAAMDILKDKGLIADEI